MPVNDDERQPSRKLADMRLIYDGTLDTAGRPLTRSQEVLQKLYDEQPAKFMLELGRLQIQHDKKIEAIGSKPHQDMAQPVDEGHTNVEKLLDELIAGFDPVAEAKLYEQERQARPK